MWGGKAAADAGQPALARVVRLARFGNKQISAKYAVETVLAWLQGLLQPTGVAYVLTIVCLVVQTICVNMFLVRFVSTAMLVTLVVEVPLVLHVAWFWRKESAHRAAPVEWLVYSWVHAAKVVVLFCRVMPALPSARSQQISFDDLGANVTSESRTEVLGYSLEAFDDIFIAPFLAALLLFTPVFYALLMFRTSKAIFGSFSQRITVDRIMHFDMLWHVVIDMVDQVDMFYLARLPELYKESGQQFQSQLVAIQNIVACMLFLSIALQAQALPGVFVDRWPIPEPPAPPKELEQGSTGTPLKATRSVRKGVSSMLFSSYAAAAVPSSGHLPSVPASPASGEAFPADRLAPLAAVGSSRASLRAEYKAPASTQAALSPFRRSLQLTIAASQEAGAKLSQPRGDMEEPLQESEPEVPRTSGLQPRLEFLQPRLPSGSLAREAGQASGPRSTEDSAPLAGSFRANGHHRSSSGNSTGSGMFMRALTPGMSSEAHLAAAASPGLSPSLRTSFVNFKLKGKWEQSRRQEKERCDRLEDIIQRIHRQSVIIARKRSAMGSIFFTDLPFLSVRIFLTLLLGMSLPGLAVKNTICIVLNLMQYGVVSRASREAFSDIQRELAVYFARFCSSAVDSKGSGPEETPARRSPLEVTPALRPSAGTPSEQTLSAASTPQQAGGRSPSASPKARAAFTATASRKKAVAEEAWETGLPAAKLKVRRETLRTTGVCVHFWSLFLAAGAGLLLSKGEGFVLMVVDLVKDPFLDNG